MAPGQHEVHAASTTPPMVGSVATGVTTIVVPCFNEAARLHGQRFIDFVRCNEHVRFLFVDDGSSDDTARAIRELSALEPYGIQLLQLPENVGKAEAVRRGVMQAVSEPVQYVGYWDADLATPLEELASFIDRLESSPSVYCVLGSRVRLLGTRVQRTWIRHYLGRIFATAASHAIGLPVYDTQCGAKLFRAEPRVIAAFQAPFCSRWMFDVELLARLVDSVQPSSGALQQQEGGIVEQPLKQWIDVKGSKVRTRDGLRAAWDLLLIAWRRRAT